MLPKSGKPDFGAPTSPRLKSDVSDFSHVINAELG
jgi:hypothetical protein